MLVMLMPAFHHARPDRELIDISEWGGIKAPIGTENFTQGSAIVNLCRCMADHYAFDHPVYRLSVGFYGHTILLWLHWHGKVSWEMYLDLGHKYIDPIGKMLNPDAAEASPGCVTHFATISSFPLPWYSGLRL